MDKWLGLWQESTPEGRLRCLLCPRGCTLRDGQHGFCFVRRRQGPYIINATYGKSSGFAIDPVEKKPLNHFLPGTGIFSFGTAGCNMGCQFCQNWHISKVRHDDSLVEQASPQVVALAAQRSGCRSMAFTYNDPIIWAEYAIDCAQAAHDLALKSVAVTAGYINLPAAKPFFAAMDAANIDLKAFSPDFYSKWCFAKLQPVLDTLVFVKHETKCWLELTTLIIPGLNDQSAQLKAMFKWIVQELGSEVPLHLTAFHPAFRAAHLEATTPEILMVTRQMALDSGLKFVYCGNIRDPLTQSTYCPECGELLIERCGFHISKWQLDTQARCRCGAKLAGAFEAEPGRGWRRR